MDLRLGAIDTTNVTNRRRREKKTIRKYPKQFNIKKILKRRTNAWKMHEHVTCKVSTSWAQPNSILPAHKEIVHI